MIRPNEIYLANFPFGDAAGMKLRPVLALSGPVGSVPEVLVAYISSVIPETRLPSDLLVDPALAEYQRTKLKTKSVIRLHKLATIHTSSISRRLGNLPTSTVTDIRNKLVQLLRL